MDSQEQRQYLQKEFQIQLLRFIDELLEQFPQSTDLVLARVFVKDQSTSDDLLFRFIRELLPHKALVVNRDDTFFLENSLLATKGHVESEKADFLATMWRENRLDEQDKLIIWEWMDVFMQIADKYNRKFLLSSETVSPAAIEKEV